MKLGYVALSMAVDIYIIREYRKVDDMYEYSDLIEIRGYENRITGVNIVTKPRNNRMHEDWWRTSEFDNTINDLMQGAIVYLFNGGKHMFVKDRIE